MEWTEQQLSAINIRDKNILVSAAAGSGKTAVLTERIVKVITEERVPISRFLVVTFTNLAAAEMRSRITAALENTLMNLSGEDGELSAFLGQQLAKIGMAKIMTFHAFALSIVREHFQEIGLDPSFKTADEHRATILREEAMDELLKEKFDEKSEEFIDFCNNYASLKSEGNVRAMIAQLYDFITDFPDGFAWLDAKIESLTEFEFTKNFQQLPGLQNVYREIRKKLEAARVNYKNAQKLIKSYGKSLERFRAYINEELSQVEDILEEYDKGDFVKTQRRMRDYTTSKFPQGNSYEKPAWIEIKDVVSGHRKTAKKIVEDVRDKFFSNSMQVSKYNDGYISEIRHTIPYAQLLGKLVHRFDEIYATIKRREGLLDFTDFERYALEILKNDEVCELYRQNIDYIFVDEYQDVNIVQETLINKIRNKRALFLVGDVKQSIYGFRGAEPRIFLNKYNHFPRKENAAVPNIRIDLTSNFRSKKPIIDAVNAVFVSLMEKSVSGIDYANEAKLVSGIENRLSWNEKPMLYLLEAGDAAERRYDKKLGYEVESEAEKEARLVASLIKKTIGKLFFDIKLGRKRAYEYRDIVVLLRAAKTDAEIFAKTLAARGIPAYTEKGEDYFETLEIDTFLGLLKAIDNPRQDEALAVALSAPIFSFLPHNFGEIRREFKEGEFHRAFFDYAENGEINDLRERCKKALETLERWQSEERFMRLDDFLWKLMLESGIYEKMGGMSRGLQRQANLRELLVRAAGQRQTKSRGLFGFLEYLEPLAGKASVQQVKLANENENVVRIMTIHGSKGLEFPMVILARLGKALARGGANGRNSLRLHKDIGLALEWENYEDRTHKKTLLSNAVREMQKVEERAEQIRLLYVAMTRAMDRLYMVGTLRKVEETVKEYQAGLNEEGYEAITAPSYLKMLLPTICIHKDLSKLLRFENFDKEEKEEFERSMESDEELFDQKEAETKEESSNDNDNKGQWVYPYEAATKLRSKYGVTEILKEAEEEVKEVHLSDAPSRYFFAESKDEEDDEDAMLGAAEKGTALHNAFELLDFAEAAENKGNIDWFVGFLERLTEKGILSPEEASAVGAETLARFAETQLCERAAKAEFCFKELPFNMKMRYGEAFADAEGAAAEEEIVVQGKIDCLFKDAEGRLVLVDYKSGRFKEGSAEDETRIRETYSGQLALYRRAVEQAFEEPVAESLAYMTQAGVALAI